MDTNYTHILYILDRSGSMGIVRNDVTQGFDSFVSEQKAQPGKCTFSLYQFDDVYEKFYDFADISQVGPLTFFPRGTTALLDAIGRAMAETGKSLREMPEHQRPGKVLVIIHTDGEENASRGYKKVEIGEMIRHQEEKYQWKVMFIGTNFDVIGEATSIGVTAGYTLHYANNSRGISDAYCTISNTVSSLRGADMETYSTTTSVFNQEQPHV